MKTFYPVFLAIVIFTAIGCQKENSDQADQSASGLFSKITLPKEKTILVDASKDGGVWWFPQEPATGFSEADAHQGKALADYLRSHGYRVDELPRGAVITKELLAKYARIIRAPAFFPYAEEEIAAYKQFLNKPGAILLMQDHLMYTTNDKLSELLGLEFKGAVDGIISTVDATEIAGGTSLPYIAGAVVTNTINNPNITVLGILKKDDYIILNNKDPYEGGGRRDAPVMGVVNNYPLTRIFFYGDGSGIICPPQTFSENLGQWLF